MKKLLLVLATVVTVVVMIIFLTANEIFAEEVINHEKVSGSIELRNNLIFPEKGEDLTSQTVNVYLQYKQFSGYLETCYKSQDHSFVFKPSIQYTFGHWSLLLGVSSDNSGSDFVQAGLWYANNFGKFKVLVDARNYFSISGKSDGFTDNTLRVMYSITEKISIGTDLMFDRWWNDSHNWYLFGPRVSYQFNNNISLFIRASRDWDVKNIETTTTDQIRTGLIISF